MMRNADDITIRFFNENISTGELICQRMVCEDYRVVQLCNDLQGCRPDILRRYITSLGRDTNPGHPEFGTRMLPTRL
jgi:hypothetical protein